MVQDVAQVCEAIHKGKRTPTELCQFKVVHRDLKARRWYHRAFCFSGVIDNVMLGSIHLTHVNKVLLSIC